MGNGIYGGAGVGAGSNGIYGSGGGGGGVPVGTGAAGGKKKGHGGLLGLAEHLGADIKDSVAGLPAGLAQLGTAVAHDVTDPGQWNPLNAGSSETYKKIVKPTLATYEATYGPLLHGDIAEFGRQLYAHPLGPLLDLATVFSAGGVAAAKLGAKASDLGLLSDTSRLARLGDRGVITVRGPSALEGELGALSFSKPTSRNPAVRARQQLVDKALKSLPYEFPVVAELARFGRELRRAGDVGEAGLRVQARDYLRAFGALNKNERIAVGVLSRVPLPEHLESWKQILATEAKAGSADARRLLDQVSDPKVNELYLQPNERMLRAHAAADKLGQVAAQTLSELGVLTERDAVAARYRHSRLAAGGVVYTARQARTAVKQIDQQLRRLDREQATVERLASQLRERGTPELRAARRQADTTAREASAAAQLRQRVAAVSERSDGLRSRLTEARVELDRLSRQGVGKTAEARTLGKQLRLTSRLAEQYDRSLAELQMLGRRELPSAAELAGRRGGELSDYLTARKDIASRLHAGRAELERIANLQDELAARRAEIRPGIVGADVERMREQIAAAGRPQPIYLPDVPAEPRPRTGGGGPYTYGSPVHQSEGMLFLSGQLALEPDVLGPHFLRVVAFARYRELHDLLLDAGVRVPRSQALPPPGMVWLRRPVGTVDLPALGKLLPDPEDIPGSELARRGFGSGDLADALVDSGYRWAVPEKLVKQVGEQYRQESRATRWLISKPLTVWRALVLNLRVGWLVNNIVGNHLLYAIRNAGPAGLRAYANMILNARGPATVRRMLKIADPDGLSRQLFEQRFPEQAGGTFIETQRPVLRGDRLKPIRQLSGKLAEADRAVEGGLRKAATEAAIRRSPEYQAIRRRLPREARQFETIARQALDENPLLARAVSDEVNATLGSFLSLTNFEKTRLRQLIPFWAWYRAITQVTLKLALDTPGRALALARLGQIGAEQVEQAFNGKVPDFLRGSIILGPPGPDGRIPLLNLSAANPLGTVPQVGTAAADLLFGRAGAAAPTFGTLLNPYLQTGIEQLTGNDLFTGGDVHQSLPGLAGGLIENIGTSLPQYRLGEGVLAPAESPLYGQRTPLDELLAFLGAPHRKVNPSVAAGYAEKGR